MPNLRGKSEAESEAERDKSEKDERGVRVVKDRANQEKVKTKTRVNVVKDLRRTNSR